MNNLLMIAHLREQLFDARQEVKALRAKLRPREQPAPSAREAGKLGGGGPFNGIQSTDIKEVLIKDAQTKYERHLGWEHYCVIQKSTVTVYDPECSYCGERHGE